MASIINASTSSGLVNSADTSGQLEIQSNGSTKLTVSSTGVTATSIQGTIVQGTAVASTSGTSIDFTGIPSWAKRVTVMFNGVSTSGSSSILVQLGTSSGVTSSGYISGSGRFGASSVNAQGYTTGFGANIAGSGSDTHQGALVITNLDSNTWVSQGGLAFNSGSFYYTMGGGVSLAATLDRIRITTVNGTDTFDAGSINIQYEG